MSDKATDLIARDDLSRLINASIEPEVQANTIPRERLRARGSGTLSMEMDSPMGSISPLAVLFVLAMLITVFIAIVRI